MALLAIIRVRGVSGIKPQIRKAMELLRLTRKNHCVIVKEYDTLKGSLNICKDYVTWGTVAKDTLTALVEKRGRLSGDKHVPNEMISNVVAAMEKGEPTNIKPVFRLSPPRKGWKSIKLSYPTGGLGNRGEKVNELLFHMM